MTFEEFKKDIGFPNATDEEIDEAIIQLSHNGYLRVFEYDDEGRPIKFNLDAENKQEADTLLAKFKRRYT